jgi:hypothetical protein
MNTQNQMMQMFMQQMQNNPLQEDRHLFMWETNVVNF